jgi:indole-3-glycerol phosphate synthase
MQKADGGFLGELVRAAEARVARGYYAVPEKRSGPGRSLAEAILTRSRIPIIAEVKFRSPAEGMLSSRGDAGKLARAYEDGGAAGVSVLTEPEHFDGRLEDLSAVRGAVNIPVLMKDIVVSEDQVVAARSLGADAVLLIASAFARGDREGALPRLVEVAHGEGLEVLLEVHDEEEYLRAMSGEADVIGVNNRDLRTLKVSLETSRRLLALGPHKKPVICESGVRLKSEVKSLRDLGADGFLMGSALMRSGDPAGMLRILTEV